VDRLERYAADTADSMRRVLKAVGTEVTDCPRLFTLTRQQATGVGRMKIYEDRYRLLLWCEHPGQWHPWPAATYHIRRPKDWLADISPYAILVFKILKVVVPIAGAVAGLALTEEQLKRSEHELELMKAVVDQMPERKYEQQELDLPELRSQLTASQGEALRGIRVVLLEQDRLRSFGGLRRIHAPSGDFLWVCTDHYAEYDPGLPSVPGSEQTSSAPATTPEPLPPL
jgi:internalin A